MRTLALALRLPLRASLLVLAVIGSGLAVGSDDARAAGAMAITQMFGGGGNTGSVYMNDFVEIMNRSVSPVNITGWTLQYASATGSSWTSTALSGTLPPGGYYLVGEGSGGGGTTPLPTPDATGSMNLSATSGKIALVNDATLLTGTCPSDASIQDFVGYNTTANCFEGFQPAPSPSVVNSDQRLSQGCQDTDSNGVDFLLAAANPRNSQSPANECHVVPVSMSTWGRMKGIYR